MSSEQVPSRTEVMGWSPQQLANYLKRMNLSGSDKVVIKNGISGSRFVNLTENDIQKFPKLQAPMISKMSADISRKEEKRGLFSRKPTTKYQEPDVTADDHWSEDEFEDEFDDYESPYSGDEKASGSDYEEPNDDDYEPTPSEPPEDLNLFPTRPIGDSEYIDNRNNHVSSSGPPPIVSPRPPVAPPSAQSRSMFADVSSSSRRDHSPHTGPRGKLPPEPPQISRDNKPGRHPTSSASHGRGPPCDRPSTNNWKAQQDAPPNSPWLKPPVPPSSTSIGRSNSSARTPPNRPAFEAKRDGSDEAIKHNTFPLQNRSLRPVPGLPGSMSGHGDSLPPHIPSAGSLPHKLSAGMAEQKTDFLGHMDRHSFRPPLTPAGRTQASQELDPLWYVGRVTRGQAENCLRRVHKDGAYLVRDSTRQLAEQPFTLMVLYQTKVYNVQIRQKNQQFLLGTGLKVQESFPSVSGIIAHYSQSPLLLIDAKNRSSCQQNQCLLSEPVGYCMPTKDWS